MHDLSELIPAPLVRQELRITQKRFDALADTGRLTVTRSNGRVYCTRAAIERYRAEQAALEAGHLTPAILANMDAAQASLGDTVRAICVSLIQAEVGFRSLEGDHAEAVSRENLPLADAIRDTINTLRAARFHWNGTAWVIDAPGLTATTRPTTPIQAGA